MQVLPCMLLIAACVLATSNADRRTKLPFIADAVGNTLPPPSNVPATVGSPVNLLTPDRYEFYTFDESGELVKRLMTLEEIQAIVAAGEEAEGLVTFAYDNQPTMAFNYSQPPHTKVHNVVTQVQNVLKAQMEAHKNKPHLQPTLDTPDVSDSWSLILPSIFGNTGEHDIVPDKISGSFTPETDTFELVQSNDENDDNSLSKEGSHQIASSLAPADQEVKDTVTEKLPAIMEVKTTVTTTTAKPTTAKSTTTTAKPTTTTAKATTTTAKPTTTTAKPSTTTATPTTTTTTEPSTTTRKPTPSTTTTAKPRPTTTSRSRPTTTLRPRTTTTTPKPTTFKQITTTKPSTTTKRYSLSTSTPKPAENKVQIQTVSNDILTTDKIEQFEKLSTFIPVSTVQYVTERTTRIPPELVKLSTEYTSTTKRSITTTAKISTTEIPKISTTINPLPTYTPKEQEFEKVNITTITTQSVSPSTTASSTELITAEKHQPNNNSVNENRLIISNNDIKDEEPIIPIFDVAQSISQIASDLGGNYQPLPTTSNLLETTQINTMDLESKENIDMDIPSAPLSNAENESNITNTSITNKDNFVQISTLVPHAQEETNNIIKEEEKSTTVKGTTEKEVIKITTEALENFELTTAVPDKTTIDPILTESMDDLLSQVVNNAPQPISDAEENSNDGNKAVTTEKNLEPTITVNVPIIDAPSENDIQIKIETNKPKVHSTESTNTVNRGDIDENSMNINDENTSSDKENIELPIESDSNEDKDENYIKIAVSANSNTSNTESANNANITQFINNNNMTKPDEIAQTPFKETIHSNEKTDVKIPIADISTSSAKENTMAPTKPKENVLSNPHRNKMESQDKIEKNKEKDKSSFPPSPKIDEFKKKIQKLNIDEKELANERNNSWKLIPSVSPPKVNEIPKDKVKVNNHYTPDNNDNKDIILDFSQENQGLEVTTKDLGEDIVQFTELCNELAFRYWNVMVENIDKRRSFVLSPYSITSMLAMMFMGARGATSGEMNEILKLDDMVTFNPHFTLKNISDSIETSADSGVIVSAFIRELYSDRNKGKILTFYKERAQHFYNGHVEEINFKLISDIIRRRTNLLVKRYTWGRIAEYMKTNTIVMHPPLAAFSANIFQTDCTGSSVEGRDGEMYFVVSPNVRQRRLVPVPAVVYKSGFLAGYDPVLDATAAATGNTNSIISTLFLMPGQQGNVVHPEDLEALEQRLLDANPSTPTWNRLLRTLLPRNGLELQIPRFSHKSSFNVSDTLRKMGLKDLFDADHADLAGLNGPSKDLYLSDMIQSTTFVTCGEGPIGEQHHIEEYPESLGAQRRRTSRWANDWDEPRDYQRAFHDPHDVGEAMHLPLHLRPRQARLPARSTQPARLKFDRPFLYFVRHNPTGMILYVGRYNPRLLP